MTQLWTFVVIVLVILIPNNEGYRTIHSTGTRYNPTFFYNKQCDSAIVSSLYGSKQDLISAELLKQAHLKQSKVQRENTSTGELTSLRPANNADITRGALVRIIEESWSKVSMLIPEHTLALCEEVNKMKLKLRLKNI